MVNEDDMMSGCSLCPLLLRNSELDYNENYTVCPATRIYTAKDRYDRDNQANARDPFSIHFISLYLFVEFSFCSDGPPTNYIP